MDQIYKLACRIANCLHSDSHVPVAESLPKISRGLESDMSVPGSRLPDDGEIEFLVYGGDEGSTPEEVLAKWPATYEAIGSFF